MVCIKKVLMHFPETEMVNILCLLKAEAYADTCSKECIKVIKVCINTV